MTLPLVPPVQYRFRLFVAANAANSSQALANLRSVCTTYLPDRHSIDIVDVFSDPGRALAEGVLMTPTLIKLEPLPVRRIVGTLSQLEVVLETLDLAGIRP